MIVAQEGCTHGQFKLAQEVCEKDEAVFEHAEHGQLAPVVSRAYLLSERAHALSDRRRAENLYEPFIHHATTPSANPTSENRPRETGRPAKRFHVKRRPRLFQLLLAISS